MHFLCAHSVLHTAMVSVPLPSLKFPQTKQCDVMSLEFGICSMSGWHPDSTDPLVAETRFALLNRTGLRPGSCTTIRPIAGLFLDILSAVLVRKGQGRQAGDF